MAKAKLFVAKGSKETVRKKPAATAPEKEKEKEKEKDTPGVTYQEAIAAANKGTEVSRQAWEGKSSLVTQKGRTYKVMGARKDYYRASEEDVLATDWIIK